MTIKSNITDKSTNLCAEVVEEWNGNVEKKALVVATRPLKYFENSVRFFTNPEYGTDMNQNAAVGGTPDKVHDGTDSSLWTGSQPAGGSEIIFDSVTQNHTAAGGKSVYFNRLEVNDVCQFAKGSDINLNNYQSLTLWVYVDNNWIANDSFSIFGWDSATGTLVGNIVYLENYFTYNNYDVWQKITIPLTDMGIGAATTVDALIIQCNAIGGTKPRFYIDDIQFEETGTPLAFNLTPEKGTWLYVDEFTISIADDIAGTLADATMGLIAYNKFLGVTLTSGLDYTREHDGEILFTQTISSVLDFMQLPNTEITGSGCDGTNSWVTIRARHNYPLILKAENNDILSWTISEDLSGLLQLRITAGCRIEQRE